MKQALGAIVRVGFAGPVALAVLGLSLVGALGLLVAALSVKRATGGSVLRWFAGVEAALFAASLGLVYSLVTAGRRVMLGIERTRAAQPGVSELEAWAKALEQTESALLIGGVSLVAAGLLLALATAVWLFRTREARDRPSVLGSIVLLGSSLLAATTALALHRHAASVLAPSRCDGPRILCWDASIAEAHAPFDQARVLVLAIAAVATLILVAVAVVPRPHGERRLGRSQSIAAALVLAAGLGGVAITRAQAHDAARPIPAQATSGSLCAMGPELDARALPEVSSCAGRELPYPVTSPLLEVTGAGAFIDGTRVDLDQADALLRKKRELYGATVWPQPVTIAAAAGARLTDVAPYLRVVRASFGPVILIALALPRGTWPTRTLGDLPLSPHCCMRAVHLGTGPPATSYPTWGDLAAAAALPGDAILGVTP